MARFAKTHCSQCGGEFGPGDSGFSHCGQHAPGLLTKAQLGVQTIDDCVRMVTAFGSFADLKDTQPTWAPKFYSRPTTTAEAYAQRRVVSAFNAWAEREGRPARAFIGHSKAA